MSPSSRGFEGEAVSSADDMAAQLGMWTAAARAKAHRYQAMRAQAAQVSVTETSRDDLVTVTVDSTGNVTDLRISDELKGMCGGQLTSAVLSTLRRAQAGLPEQLAEVTADTIGDDQQTMAAVLTSYRARFPCPTRIPDDPPAPVCQGQVGDTEDAEESPADRESAAPRPRSAGTPRRRQRHNNLGQGRPLETL